MSKSILKFSVKKLIKRLERHLKTHICKETGFLFQLVNNERVYLRNRQEYLSKKSLDKLCNDYYYKYYLPQKNDTVVCIGAGLGHEAIWLKKISPNINYIGIEIQPFLYELLSNTFKKEKKFNACGNAINDKNQNYYLISASNYTAVSTDENGYIEVNSLSWEQFIAKYKIDRINLLQINIEGAERYLLPMIKNYKNIEHIIISAHDFRANRGDGEQFRTREFVREFLQSEGYSIVSCGNKPRQEDWLFASRIKK
jgi:FkbM family methyltransferase